MEKELKEIVMKMNEFSKKYDCKIEVETFNVFADNELYETIYKLKAIKPQECIAEYKGGKLEC